MGRLVISILFVQEHFQAGGFGFLFFRRKIVVHFPDLWCMIGLLYFSRRRTARMARRPQSPRRKPPGIFPSQEEAL
ncbi:MAG: hypothetical protein HDT14_10490 [Oscillibacter sp.]|nr:hypothetical protein [Oscillibacter sp.]